MTHTNAVSATAVLSELRKTGWCKNMLHDDEGRSCLVGAASKIRGTRNLINQEDYLLFATTFSEVAREQFPERFKVRDSGMAVTVLGCNQPGCNQPRCRNSHDCVYFNNHPDTTFEEMEMVLEKVAARG